MSGSVRFLSIILSLSAELRHPCARRFSCTIEEIGIQHSKYTAVALIYLESLHIGVINLYILILLESIAIKTCGKTEDSANGVL